TSSSKKEAELKRLLQQETRMTQKIEQMEQEIRVLLEEKSVQEQRRRQLEEAFEDASRDAAAVKLESTRWKRRTDVELTRKVQQLQQETSERESLSRELVKCQSELKQLNEKY